MAPRHLTGQTGRTADGGPAARCAPGPVRGTVGPFGGARTRAGCAARAQLDDEASDRRGSAVVTGGALARSFARVARSLQAQETAQQTLEHVVELARETVPGCDFAGVSWIEDGQVLTPAATGQVPEVVDRIQYETDEGPCLSALRLDDAREPIDPVVSVDLAQEVRWPRFTARAVAETGVRSMLSFQLYVEGRVLGALNLYATSAGAFERDSLLLGEVFAGHAAVALAGAVTRDEVLRTRHDLQASASQAARLVQRVALGSVLQASMLTDLAGLTRPRDLELAALYRPAADEHEVGGDWYDVFDLPGGATGLVIGDVSGHDAAAAATMGVLRNMLRVLAWDRAAPPARVLSRLDAALAGLGVPAIASVVLVRVEPETGTSAGAHRIHWSSAGHLPPMLAMPGAGVRVMDEAPDLLLGVRPSVPRHDHATTVPAASTLLLYTDGLVERRGENLQVGIDRLAGALAASRTLGLSDLLREVTDRVVEREGVAAEDDTAALAVRTGPRSPDGATG